MYSSVRMRILLSLEVLLEKCLTVITGLTPLRIENSGIFLFLKKIGHFIEMKANLNL